MERASLRRPFRRVCLLVLRLCRGLLQLRHVEGVEQVVVRAKEVDSLVARPCTGGGFEEALSLCRGEGEMVRTSELRPGGSGRAGHRKTTACSGLLVIHRYGRLWASLLALGCCHHYCQCGPSYPHKKVLRDFARAMKCEVKSNKWGNWPPWTPSRLTYTLRNRPFTMVLLWQPCCGIVKRRGSRSNWDGCKPRFYPGLPSARHRRCPIRTWPHLRPWPHLRRA